MEVCDWMVTDEKETSGLSPWHLEQNTRKEKGRSSGGMRNEIMEF
jgi:hypothetical protein